MRNVGYGSIRKEITPELYRACDKLTRAGVPLGNQAVLLAGINDSVHIQREMVQQLIQMRVRPYYLYQCDLVEGAGHFRTTVNKGIEIIEGLRGVEPSDQLRLVAVKGPDGATILDDTYNASPASTVAALNLLDELEGRRIAVLGDMLELGYYEQEGHEKVGMRALEVADVLVTVGALGRIIGEVALRWGMSSDQVYMLGDNEEAVSLLKRLVGGNDVVLVKGSRAMKMEEIVNALSLAS